MEDLGDWHANPGPVMTFRVEREWIAVHVEQVDSVVCAPRLYSVPFTRPEYVGLLDAGETLVPVLGLAPVAKSTDTDQLVAILRVRGASVGLAIERAGRIYEHYWPDAVTTPPCFLTKAEPRLTRADEQSFWLVDTDNLWQETTCVNALA